MVVVVKEWTVGPQGFLLFSFRRRWRVFLFVVCVWLVAYIQVVREGEGEGGRRVDMRANPSYRAMAKTTARAPPMTRAMDP